MTQTWQLFRRSTAEPSTNDGSDRSVSDKGSSRSAVQSSKMRVETDRGKYYTVSRRVISPRINWLLVGGILISLTIWVAALKMAHSH
jgi:hypothetical protein